MGSEITKKDLLNAKSQFESLLVNALINCDCYNASIEMLENKLKQFPEEEKKDDDPMPDGLKEVLTTNA